MIVAGAFFGHRTAMVVSAFSYLFLSMVCVWCYITISSIMTNFGHDYGIHQQFNHLGFWLNDIKDYYTKEVPTGK